MPNDPRTGTPTARRPAAIARFARLRQIELQVVGCGIAEAVASHARLHGRKLAYFSRKNRLNAAMRIEQAQAGVRGGMDVAATLPDDA